MSPKEPQSRCVTPRARPKRVWGRGATLSVCVHACVSAPGRDERSQNKRRDALLFRRLYFRIVEEKRDKQSVVCVPSST